MSSNNWVETRKEYEVDDAGVHKLKKYTTEPKKGFEKKDIIDLIFKTIGLLAIGLPILIFLLQQQASIRAQRTTEQAEIINKTAAQLRTLQSSTYDDSLYIRAKENLLNDLGTRINLFFPDSINFKLEKTIETADQCGLIISFCEKTSELLTITNKLAGNLASLTVDDEPITANDITTEDRNDLIQMNEIITDWIDVSKKMQQQLTDSTVTDPDIKEGMMQMQQIFQSLQFKFWNIKDKCNEIMTLAENDIKKNQQDIKKSCEELNAPLVELKTDKVKSDVKQTEESKRKYKEVVQTKRNNFLKAMKSSNKLLNM